MRSVLIKDPITSAASVRVPSAAETLNGFTSYGDMISSTRRQCCTCLRVCVCVSVRVLEVIQESQ